MPIKKRKLTPRRVKLAAAMARTNSAQAAAIEAKMSLQGAYAALRSPEVQAIIWREQMHRLRVVGVPVAISALIDVASDPEERGSARAQAAKIIMDQAQEQAGAGDKSIDQMTIDEMNDRLAELKSARAEAAKIIDAEVIEPGALD